MARLSARELSVAYRTDAGPVRAVDRVSFDIEAGEVFGVVGESGCGKSTLANTVLRLLDDNGEVVGGTLAHGDRELTAMSERELADEVRGSEISMVFQDPNTSLDPVYTVGQQLVETIRRHLDVSRGEARERAIRSLADVGIPSPEDRLDDYPHQFSGGMRQRAVIAIALSCDPDLLIADEPTTGLDVSIQAQILDLLERINDERETSIMLITHDLGVVAEVCDRVGVMYAGNVVEIGDVEPIFEEPSHPYTRALLRSLPEAHGPKEDLSVIEGSPPDLRDPPAGCRYAPRCDAVCGPDCESGDVPPTYRAGTEVRCYLYDAGVNPEYDGPTEVVAEPGRRPTGSDGGVDR
jgi:oligopeptide/dipeptide ABC transporter ATP-binding protein